MLMFRQRGNSLAPGSTGGRKNTKMGIAVDLSNMHNKSTTKSVLVGLALACVCAALAGCAATEKKIKGQESASPRPEPGVYHFTCAQEPGRFCQEFLTPEGAKSAEKVHREATGHTETLTAPGRCP